jgi:dTDP-4-amino-4,6-dideoxy-D-galactose acyltransferase
VTAVAENAAEPCELLPWDTQFFGFRVARVRGGVLTSTRADEIEAWCTTNGIACLYFLARSDDAQTVVVAEARGYHLADVRLTLDREIGGEPQISCLKAQISDGIRPARAEDVPQLRAIARVSHADTRFFYDPRFPRPRAEALYETWIESSVSGFAQAVLVAEHGGDIAGYLSCHLTEAADTGSIGLVAVAAGQQRRGVGKGLVAAGCEWFESRGAKQISVVTQGRNVAAQRLYARCGFIARKVELYYHRWFATPR